MSDPAKLIRMANQIAAFFETQPGEAAQGVARHINDFWAPAMRADLAAALSEPAGLHDCHPLVLAAAPLLRTPAA